MALLRLKFVNSYRDKTGRTRHYFRRGAVREPLPGIPGSAAFMEEYKYQLTLHAPAAPARRGKPSRGTLAWVIGEFKANSQQWQKIKPATRLIYDRHFAYLAEHYGVAEFASFDESGVRAIRNKLRDRPSVADNIVDKIGMLWRYAKEHIDGMDKLGANPAREVAAIHTERTPHKAWPRELCAAIEKHPNPRVIRAYHLLRYTGQRRSDVAAMKTSQFDGNAVELYQIKTGTYVWTPAHSTLIEHLTSTGIDGEYLLMSSRGSRFNEESLTRLIREACTEVGFPGFTPHGLRHAAGSALAEAGCSVHEIMAVLGHITENEAAEYARQANRKTLATSAMAKWDQPTTD
jgi:integrase